MRTEDKKRLLGYALIKERQRRAAKGPKMADDDLPTRDAETYLGDGLYARFDGFAVILRAPREGGDHFVGLEPEVYRALREWLRRYPRLAGHMGEVR